MCVCVRVCVSIIVKNVFGTLPETTKVYVAEQILCRQICYTCFLDATEVFTIKIYQNEMPAYLDLTFMGPIPTH